ncbi:hypothetical protein BJ878DRAFT_539982 [Calycina marina]|uniref:Transmembrane protein n=1 Tax=Calycina marina TaxID=1763456 RepID=A0A9P7Z6X8_9HELO|nr:hypothetical protein BJ878DRAFT_539982 [Calycina marina]
MSTADRKEDGGRPAGGISVLPSVFNNSGPVILPPITTIEVPVATVFVSTSVASTFSTISYRAINTTASEVVTQTLPVTIVPVASLVAQPLLAQQAVIRSGVSLAKTSVIIVAVLCGFIAFLVLALVLFAFSWARRRRGQEARASGSIPLETFAASHRDAAQLPPYNLLVRPASFPSGLGAAFSSHPPNTNLPSFSRPFTVPSSGVDGPDLRGPQEGFVPETNIQSNIQPNTPAILGPDVDPPILPLVQAGSARTPFYHEEDPRLAVPRQIAQRQSVVSMGSIYEDISFGRQTPEHLEPQNSTRSSGVFPRP